MVSVDDALPNRSPVQYVLTREKTPSESAVSTFMLLTHCVGVEATLCDDPRDELHAAEVELEVLETCGGGGPAPAFEFDPRSDSPSIWLHPGAFETIFPPTDTGEEAPRKPAAAARVRDVDVRAMDWVCDPLVPVPSWARKHARHDFLWVRSVKLRIAAGLSAHRYVAAVQEMSVYCDAGAAFARAASGATVPL